MTTLEKAILVALIMVLLTLREYLLIKSFRVIVENLQVHRLHFVVSKFISVPFDNEMGTAFPVFLFLHQSHFMTVSSFLGIKFTS